MKYLWIILIPCLCFAQIQEKVVKDFSGGLTPALSATTMADNQALELINYDVSIDENNNFGELKRRRGMTVFWPDAYFGEIIEGLVPYYAGVGFKKLLVRRVIPGSYTDDTASAFIDHFTICDETIPACSVIGFSPLYQGRRNPNTFNQDYSSLYRRTYIASTKSEMVYYNGDNIVHVRSVGPGQPRAVVIDGAGPMTGRFTYKYCWVDTIGDGDDGTPDTSRLSSPSWSVDVQRGKVFLEFEGPRDTSRQNNVLILRHADTSTQVYEQFANLGDPKYMILDTTFTTRDSVFYFTDTFPASFVGDTMKYSWGNAAAGGAWNILPQDTINPPGGIEIDTSDLFGYFIYSKPDLNNPDSITNISLWYCLAYIDSAGRESYPSAVSGVIVDSNGAGYNANVFYVVNLSDIPVPSDPSITGKIILRRIDMEWWKLAAPEAEPESLFTRWYLLDTIDATATTFLDTFVINETQEYYNGDLWRPPNQAYLILPLPEDMRSDDSVLSFQPTAIAEHGTRMYAVGDAVNPDYLWFSAFGEPRAWASDQFLALPSQQGDWFNGLLSVSNNELLAFRQNSVMRISGLTFYQYNVDEILTEVGLTAPRTLLKNQRGVYFVHQTGLWKLGMTDPLSVPIGSLIDSMAGDIYRSVAQTVNGEYWWSVPLDDTINTHTLIWVESPKPHWKKYDFGFNDATYFNPDTLSWDFTVTDLIIARDNDSLYQIDFTTRDTLDGVDTIYAVFQSKYFFAENNDREQIHWVDLDGTGTIDSLRVIFYRNYGENKPGVPFDTVVFSPDFSDHIQDRVQVGAICHNFSLRIEDFGMGNYSLKGYTIGWQPWDRGNE